MPYGRKLAVVLRDALPHPLLLPFRTGLAGVHFPHSLCTTLDIGSSRQTYLTLCRNIVISSPLARFQAVMRDRHVCCAVCSHVMVSHASPRVIGAALECAHNTFALVCGQVLIRVIRIGFYLQRCCSVSKLSGQHSSIACTLPTVQSALLVHRHMMMFVTVGRSKCGICSSGRFPYRQGQ